MPTIECRINGILLYRYFYIINYCPVTSIILKPTDWIVRVQTGGIILKPLCTSCVYKWIKMILRARATHVREIHKIDQYFQSHWMTWDTTATNMRLLKWSRQRQCAAAFFWLKSSYRVNMHSQAIWMWNLFNGSKILMNMIMWLAEMLFEQKWTIE